ncbi:hypothetical protein [Chryseobacterium sp.]|nr:hypothetical protein [Chryseobacterium sp.]
MDKAKGILSFIKNGVKFVSIKKITAIGELVFETSTAANSGNLF